MRDIMVDMNITVGRAFGATSGIAPCAKGARYAGVGGSPRAPMVDMNTTVGRAFGATRGSFRAPKAHATLRFRCGRCRRLWRGRGRGRRDA